MGGNGLDAIRSVWCQQGIRGDQTQLKGLDAPDGVTADLRLSARVAIRPRKMTNRMKSGLFPGWAAQIAVTDWCQHPYGCDKKLCLHYEMPEIHDFGSKSCSSWIHSSHMSHLNPASGRSNNTLDLWTNLVRLFRSGSI
jgi:hypothetical protein